MDTFTIDPYTLLGALLAHSGEIRSRRSTRPESRLRPKGDKRRPTGGGRPALDDPSLIVMSCLDFRAKMAVRSAASRSPTS